MKFEPHGKPYQLHTKPKPKLSNWQRLKAFWNRKQPRQKQQEIDYEAENITLDRIEESNTIEEEEFDSPTEIEHSEEGEDL